eukprot:183570-Prymnesium_polylepis.1
MADNLALAIIALAALGYVNSVRAAAPAALTAPSAQREIDLSRWRHDGSQPTVWTKGERGLVY